MSVHTSMGPASIRRRRHDADAQIERDGMETRESSDTRETRKTRQTSDTRGTRERAWDIERERFSALDHYRCVEGDHVVWRWSFLLRACRAPTLV